MDPEPDEIPLRVNQIRITGNERTHDDFIESELQPARSASNLAAVIAALDTAKDNLRAHDIFKRVHIHLVKSASALPAADGDTDPSPNVADVQVEVQERGWYGVGTTVSTEVHTGEATGRLSAVVRNLFGRGERVEASSSTGSSASNTFSLSVMKPRLFASPLRGHLGIQSAVQNHAAVASYTELCYGATASVSDWSGRHELGYTGELREIFPVHRQLTGYEKALAAAAAAPPSSSSSSASSSSSKSSASAYLSPSESVVADATPSTKSSLSYTYRLDWLDHPLLPTRGSFLRAQTELAGLGGDARFVKGQVEVKRYFPLHQHVTVGIGAMLGLLQPWGAASSPPSAAGGRVGHLSDRFFLGTPLSLRGFETFTVGPLDHHDNIGGNVTAAASLSASVALPASMGGGPGGPRLQAFLNAGNLVMADSAGGRAAYSTALRQLASDARVSSGIGLVLPTPLGRLEFNLIYPLRKLTTDRTRTLQFGLGLQFL